jgi:hypothetical protein
MVPLGHVSIDKLNELGLKYQPIEETINDTISSLKECGRLACGKWMVYWLHAYATYIANLMKIFYILKQVCFIS